VGKIKEWRADPKLYFTEVLGVEKTWKLQDELLKALPRAIEERKHIYVASGHALGKDFICGGIGLWFLQTHMPSEVVLTGPTDRQVKQIMWKETLGHWQRKKIDLGGRAFRDPLIEIEQDWKLFGFTTSETGATKEGGGGKFQGIHAPNVAVIVTESQSVEDNIYDQIDAITTNENVLVIFIGNPTRAKGRFAKGLKDPVNNIVFNFSCLENPNYLERRTVIPGLASYQWVEDKRTKWGESDPRWIGRVLGQVPDGALNNVFPGSLMEHMKERHGFIARHSDNRGVAVDSAGEGVDEEVIMSGSGGEVMDVFTRTQMGPTDSAHKAIQMCKAVNGNFIIVDCDGVGIKVYQELDGMPDYVKQGIQIIKFHGSSTKRQDVDAEEDRRIYHNLRCEAAFVARDRAKRGHAAVHYKDIELQEDLSEDLFFENKNTGLLQLIDKDEIRETLGRSPGRGDCWKMLQWAFEQNIKPSYYADDKNTQPGYARTDRDLYQQTAGHPSYALSD